jgi:hypothetical protein
MEQGWGVGLREIVGELRAEETGEALMRVDEGNVQPVQLSMSTPSSVSGR